MAENRPTVFCDGVTEAQVAHGVARITLAVTGTDGKALPCATLCIPVTQLPALVNGMGNLLRQIEERVRAQMPAPAAEPAAAAPAEGASGAFRFQS
ncbi:hypothetical protein [Roseomonas rosulenta]|uniref:hypothetical protein n=1 Tax=Roseomonas rosulenta TaxID=2748667 RepID=UPI0018E05CDA|nr:hypothetical protein [Roseomonas rosulenta]